MQSISKETLISPKAVNIDDDINHYNQKSSIAEFSFFSIEPEISNV